MVRKRSNLSGLSRFVQEAFSLPPETPATPAQPSSTTNKNASTVHSEQASIVTTASTLELNGNTHPSKKRKIGLLGPGYEKYDATGLVPFYTQPSEVPEHLQKYFSQRLRYFSQYPSGCLLDEEGWYSVTPERVADQIAERCRCDIILDAFCGVGGNAIAFARTCERVIALDTSPIRLALARHNAALYGVEDRIEFILADFVSFAQTLPRHNTSEAGQKSSQQRKIDVVFLSPPWGGPSYLSSTEPEGSPKEVQSSEEIADYNLSSIRPIHGAELFALARTISKNIAYFLPRNVSLQEVSALVTTDDEGEAEMIEVEEEWMGSKLKALTCYFGGLVAGQEHLFSV